MKTRNLAGYSLIEVMVCLVILAVLLLFAAPSYSAWTINSRIRHAAESIANGMRQARMVAVQRNQPARFELISATTADWRICMPTDPALCSPNDELIEQFNAGGNATGVQVGATNVAKTAAANALSGGTPSGVTFNPVGRPLGYGTSGIARVDLLSSREGARRLVVAVSLGGSVRMCDPQITQSTSPQACE